MKGKSFFEILEDQLRKDLRAEIEAEVRAEIGKNKKTSQHPFQDDAFQAQAASGTAESWLVSHLGKTVFSRRKEARKAYQAKPTARPQAAVVNRSVDRAVEPSIHLSATEDLVAIEFLRRHSGVRIGETLTRSELKQAWRKAALKTHPDRYIEADTITQTRMKAIFQEICTAYERIENHFNSARDAA